MRADHRQNFPLRMPPDIRHAVKAAATERKWSLNTWIVDVIEEKLRSEGKIPTTPKQ
jgi:predicted HicB family RNase H-like nuclease